MNKEQQKTLKAVLTYDKACRYIFTHYGEKMQKTQLIQELSELITALTKNDIVNMIEEMADVQIMLDQFKFTFQMINRDMQKIAKRKINRQLRRIKNEIEVCKCNKNS